MKYFVKRNLYSRYFIGFYLSILVVFAHVYTVLIPANKMLDGKRYDQLVITRWIGFDTGSLLPMFLYFIFPLLLGLGLCIVVNEDLFSGFIFRIFAKKPIKQVLNILITPLLNSLIIVTVPLIIDFLFALLLLPSKLPNIFLNYNQQIISQFTYFSADYYRLPIKLIFFYIFFATIVGYLFSLICSLLALLFKNKISSIVGGFILSVVLSVITVIFPKIFSPVYIARGISLNTLPPLQSIMFIFAGLIIILNGGLLYALKKRIIL